jgi:glycosyltransferase involved in cell wall biosynthesis
MPKLTALLHTHNDALRLGRALDSLRPCDEVLLIDDSSADDTVKIAREHGATIRTSIPGVTLGAHAMDATNDWLLCICPNESLSDDLEASLFEWKNQEPRESVVCYKVSIREQNENGWRGLAPQVRLVNRGFVSWVGEMPPDQQCDASLAGDLLRFREP